MADSCQTCFFARRDSENKDRCHVAGPAAINTESMFGTTALHPLCPTDPPWCGQGADRETGRSFSSSVNALPSGPSGPAGNAGQTITWYVWTWVYKSGG